MQCCFKSALGALSPFSLCALFAPPYTVLCNALCTLLSRAQLYNAQSRLVGSDSGVVAAPCSNCDYRFNIAEAATVFLYLCLLYFCIFAAIVTIAQALILLIFPIVFVGIPQGALIVEQNWLGKLQLLCVGKAHLSVWCCIEND